MANAKMTQTLLATLVVMIMAMGCSPTIHTTRVAGTSYADRTGESEIAVFTEGETIPRPYVILGKVFAQKRGATIFSKPSEDYLIRQMRTPAAQMGADAIIGFRSSIFDGKQRNSIKRWASGIAVRFLDEETEAVETNNDFVVAILPVNNEQATDPKKKLEENLAMLLASQFHLEKNGYYATFANDGSQVLTVEDIRNMNEDTLDELSGENAGLLFLITLSKASSSGVGIAGSGSATVSASLISKQSREVVWKNEASGSKLSLGLINTIMTKHRKAAIYNAVENLFDILTPRYAAH